MPAPPRETALAAIDVPALLKATGIATRAVRHGVGARVFAQGAPANSVFYLQEGRVKLSVLSTSGKEAIVAMPQRRRFFRRGLPVGPAGANGYRHLPWPSPRRCASARPTCSDCSTSTASSRTASSLTCSVRNIRIEEDLVDQLFNSSEKRLARTLLLLAQYGGDRRPLELPRLSQETLAEMVGTTRSRVNFFMNKFRKLGFIEYNGGLKVNSALLSIVLHD